jgi:hypothetical protein
MEPKFKTEAEADAYIREQTYGSANKVKSFDVVTQPRTVKSYISTFTNGKKFLWGIYKRGGDFVVNRLPPHEPFYIPED